MRSTVLRFSAPPASPAPFSSHRSLRDASSVSVSLRRPNRIIRSDLDRTAARDKLSVIACSAVGGDGAAVALDRKRRHPHLRASRSSIIASATPAASDDEASSAEEDEPEAEDCKIGFVTVDNASSRSCTRLRLEAADYIGLTRVVAWVLGGLGLTVRDAKLTTSEDGWARNEFWVTTESGKKLSDTRAASASERLAEFVTYCTPPPRKHGQEPRVESGGITVDSSERAHAKWTVVTVRGGGVSDLNGGGGFGGASGRVGAISSFGPSSSGSSSSSSYSSSSPLLDVASAVSGAGIAIREAIVMGGGPSCDAGENDAGASGDVVEGVGAGVGGSGDRRPTIDDDPEEGETSSSSTNNNNEPAMRLWVCEPATGGKLSYVRCAALLQTLSLALGRGGGPSLVPPAPVELRKVS